MLAVAAGLVPAALDTAAALNNGVLPLWMVVLGVALLRQAPQAATGTDEPATAPRHGGAPAPVSRAC